MLGSDRAGRVGTGLRGHILRPPGTAPGAPKAAASTTGGFEMSEAVGDATSQTGALALLCLLIAEPN